MSIKQHYVSLSEEERAQVERTVRSNKNSVRERVRARILLAASDSAGLTDKQVAEQTGASGLTVWRVRKRFAERGLEGALHHTEQAKRKERRLDGRAEAHLVALVCSAPPEGRKVWSLHLLAGKLVAAEVVESVSHETVRQTLKKMSSNPG